jgi:hypothetical protein
MLGPEAYRRTTPLETSHLERGPTSGGGLVVSRHPC